MIAAFYKRAFQLLLNSPLLAAVIVWALVVQWATQKIMGAPDQGFSRLLHALPWLAVITLVQTWFSCGFMRVSLSLLRGEPFALSRALTPLRTYVQVIFAFLLMLVPTAVGFVLLIVPGMMLVIMWSQVTYLVIDDQATGIGALRLSSDVTRGVRWEIFAAVLLMAVPVFVIAIFAAGLGAMTKPSIAVVGVGWLLQAIFAAFSLFLGVGIYETLRERLPNRFPSTTVVDAPIA